MFILTNISSDPTTVVYEYTWVYIALCQQFLWVYIQFCMSIHEYTLHCVKNFVNPNVRIYSLTPSQYSHIFMDFKSRKYFYKYIYWSKNKKNIFKYTNIYIGKIQINYWMNVWIYLWSTMPKNIFNNGSIFQSIFEYIPIVHSQNV